MLKQSKGTRWSWWWHSTRFTSFLLLALLLAFSQHTTSTAIIDLCAPLESPKDIVCNPKVFWSTSNRRHYREKHGRWGRVLARLQCRPTLPPIPSILLTSIQWVNNKLDKVHCCTSSQQDMRDWCVFCNTESWLTLIIPDRAIQPDSFSVCWLDRFCGMTDKVKGGGAWFLVNKF